MIEGGRSWSSIDLLKNFNVNIRLDRFLSRVIIETNEDDDDDDFSFCLHFLVDPKTKRIW